MPARDEARHVLAILFRIEDVRFLEQPPGVRAIAGGDDDGRSHRGGNDRERVLNRRRKWLGAVRRRPEIEVAAEAGDARDLIRCAAAGGTVVGF